jgi:hypothetical protein
MVYGNFHPTLPIRYLYNMDKYRRLMNMDNCYVVVVVVAVVAVVVPAHSHPHPHLHLLVYCYWYY